MGGIHGTVKGKTKVECWINFLRVRDHLLDTTGFVREMVTPGNKKVGYQMMQRDDKTGEWTLRFRLDK
jgi:hypothetical protein